MIILKQKYLSYSFIFFILPVLLTGFFIFPKNVEAVGSIKGYLYYDWPLAPLLPTTVDGCSLAYNSKAIVSYPITRSAATGGAGCACSVGPNISGGFKVNGSKIIDCAGCKAGSYDYTYINTSFDSDGLVACGGISEPCTGVNTCSAMVISSVTPSNPQSLVDGGEITVNFNYGHFTLDKLTSGFNSTPWIAPVRLSWTFPGLPVASFEVWKAYQPLDPLIKIADLPSSTTSYTDTDVQMANHIYKIKAIRSDKPSVRWTGPLLLSQPNEQKGTIVVNATKDGSPWSGNVKFIILGLSGQGDISYGTPMMAPVPITFTNIGAGDYAPPSSVAGGPSGTTLSSITPASSQTLSGGSTITFTLNFTTPLPAAPTPVSALSFCVANSNPDNTISWTDNSTNEDEFKIYRDSVFLATRSSTSQAGTGTSYSWTDTGPTRGTIYTYSVSASNASGDSSATLASSITTNTCSPTASSPALAPALAYNNSTLIASFNASNAFSGTPTKEYRFLRGALILQIWGAVNTYTCTLASCPIGSAITFEGRATDGVTYSGTVSAFITISNRAPIVSAGIDKTVSAGGSVGFSDTSASDPDGSALTYSWSCTGGSLSSAIVLKPTYTAPAVSGSYTCTLTASDGSLFTFDSLIVTVPTYTLSITKLGAGSGTITSVPAGINCGATCSAPYSSGIGVTLTAAFSPGSTFVGWSGDPDCSDGSVTMNADKTCTATFNIIYPEADIKADNADSATISVGSATTLEWCGVDAHICANATSCKVGTTFGGNDISTAISGSYLTPSLFANIIYYLECANIAGNTSYDNVIVTVSALPTYALTVTKSGVGSGTITSVVPAGINCGATCSALYNSGIGVTLAAAFSPGSTFVGWSGDPDCSDGDVTMNMAKTCTAMFASSPNLPTSLTAPNWSYAQASQLGALKANLRWQFSDSNPGSSESAYQIIFNNNNSIVSPIFDTGKCLGYNNPSSKCRIDIGVDSYSAHNQISLSYNTKYYWWVKVWNNYDLASNFKQYDTVPDTDNDDGDPLTFTTYKHEFPIVNFTWFPVNPSLGENVNFSDGSKYYTSATPATPTNCNGGHCVYLWIVPADAVINNASLKNPRITFGPSGQTSVTLKVTDDDGYYASLTKTLNLKQNLPSWKEVKPK